MAFSESTIKAAWERSGGKCECTRTSHAHTGRCNKQLVCDNRGREGKGKWEAHHKTAVSSGGNDSLPIVKSYALIAIRIRVHLENKYVKRVTIWLFLLYVII